MPPFTATLQTRAMHFIKESWASGTADQRYMARQSGTPDQRYMTKKMASLRSDICQDKMAPQIIDIYMIKQSGNPDE